MSEPGHRRASPAPAHGQRCQAPCPATTTRLPSPLTWPLATMTEPLPDSPGSNEGQAIKSRLPSIAVALQEAPPAGRHSRKTDEVDDQLQPFYAG